MSEYRYAAQRLEETRFQNMPIADNRYFYENLIFYYKYYSYLCNSVRGYPPLWQPIELQSLGCADIAIYHTLRTEKNRRLEQKMR